VSKVYLSRVENGHSKIAFSRMIALCRAYEYPIDAASERLWLDLGVDRMDDPPDTAGKGAKELLREGRGYLQRGFRWHAYACARDAIAVAKTTPVSEVFRDHEEQYLIATMNAATAAARLGRYRFALLEYRQIENNDAFQPKHQPLVLTHIASTLLGLSRLNEAVIYADRAIEAASEPECTHYLGDCLTTRSLIAYAARNFEDAISFCRRAVHEYKRTSNAKETANALVNLAQASFDVGRTSAARRFLAAADRLTRQHDFVGVRARALILAGEVHETSGDLNAAEKVWSEAQRLATKLGDSTLLFKVKFCLRRHAIKTNRTGIARRLERSLERMSPWIPLDTTELASFRASKGDTTGLA
jgi:tetratricopeptide (TPR) repeat protein